LDFYQLYSPAILFLPRDATHSAVMPQYVICPSIRLSVRPSMTFTVQVFFHTSTSKMISQLKVTAQIDPDVGDPVQRKHLQN